MKTELAVFIPGLKNIDVYTHTHMHAHTHVCIKSSLSNFLLNILGYRQTRTLFTFVTGRVLANLSNV